MEKKNILFLLLNIHKQERLAVLLLFMFAFFCGFTVVFTGTAANTFFLGQFNAEVLPLIYILVGVIVFLLSFVFAFLEKRLPPWLYLGGMLWVNLAVLLYFWFFPPRNAPFPAALFFIYKNVLLFQLNLALWGLANRILSIRQGKRLFGAIGSGEVLAEISGGFCSSLLLRYIRVGDLLLCATAAIFCLFLLTLVILGKLKSQISGDHKETDRSGRTYTVRRTGYVLMLFCLTAVTWLGFFFFENVFYREAKLAYTGENQLAAFFAFFFGITGFITFLGKLFVSDKMVLRFGVKKTLRILPFCTLLFLAAYWAAGYFFEAGTPLFFTTLGAMLMYKFLRSSVHKSASMVLYQPLPRERRHRVLLVAERLGGVLAGVILFLLVNLGAQPYSVVGLYLLPVFILFLFLIPLTQRMYKNALKAGLERRQFNPVNITVQDEAGIAVLEQALDSSAPGQVIYALNLLAQCNPAGLPGYLKKLLGHSQEILRRKALNRIEKYKVTELTDAVRALLPTEQPPNVKGLILRTLMAAGRQQMLNTVHPYIRDRELPVRRGALVGMLKYGGIQGVLLAGTEFLEMVRSTSVDVRITAAKIIKDIGIPEFYAPLETLLTDSEVNVRKSALQATSGIISPQLFPAVYKCLRNVMLEPLARDVLVIAGKPAVSFLIEKLRQRDVPYREKVSSIKILGSIGGERTKALLVNFLNTRQKSLTLVVIEALERCGYRIPVKEGAWLSNVLQQETADLLFLAGAWLEKPPALLGEVLKEEIGNCKTRILKLLSFLTLGDTLILAGSNIEHSSPEIRDYALELLDFVLPEEIKATLLPVLEDKLDTLKLPPAAEAAKPLCVRLLEKAVEWELTSLQTGVLAVLDKKDYPVCRHFVHQLAVSPLSEVVRNLATRLLAEFEAEGTRKIKTEEVSLLRKITLLKSARLLAGTAPSLLFELLPATRLRLFSSGTMIIKKGAQAQAMYIIASGKVRVESGSGGTHYLQTDDLLGELGMLDGETRSADVFAHTDVCLLELERAGFLMLLYRHAGLAVEIIGVLVSRLMDRIKKLDAREQKFKFQYKQVTGQDFTTGIKLLPLEKTLVLKSTLLFSHLPQELLAAFLPLLEEVGFTPGQEIIRQGEKTGFLYIILEGKILDSRFYPALRAGERRFVYGDLEIFNQLPSTTGLTALEAVTAFRISRGEFITMLERHSELAPLIIRVFTGKIRSL